MRGSVSARRSKEPATHADKLGTAGDAEIGRLHKTHALLIAVQFAANHDCEFDVSDALAVIGKRIGQFPHPARWSVHTKRNSQI